MTINYVSSILSFYGVYEESKSVHTLYFSCVVQREGLSKLNHQFVLDNSHDNKYIFLGNGHLQGVNLTNNDFYLTYYDLVERDNCFFNSLEKRIILSCIEKTSLSTNRGKTFSLDKFVMLELSEIDFPIILNQMAISFQDIMSNLKLFHTEKIIEKNLVETKNNPLLLRSKLREKNISPYKKTLTLLKQLHANEPLRKYFIGSVAAFTLSFVALMTCCLIRYYKAVSAAWKMIMEKCCPGRYDQPDSSTGISGEETIPLQTSVTKNVSTQVRVK